MFKKVDSDDATAAKKILDAAIEEALHKIKKQYDVKTGIAALGATTMGLLSMLQTMAGRNFVNMIIREADLYKPEKEQSNEN